MNSYDDPLERELFAEVSSCENQDAEFLKVLAEINGSLATPAPSPTIQESEKSSLPPLQYHIKIGKNSQVLFELLTNPDYQLGWYRHQPKDKKHDLSTSIKTRIMRAHPNAEFIPTHNLPTHLHPNNPNTRSTHFLTSSGASNYPFIFNHSDILYIHENTIKEMINKTPELYSNDKIKLRPKVDQNPKSPSRLSKSTQSNHELSRCNPIRDAIPDQTNQQTFYKPSYTLKTLGALTLLFPQDTTHFNFELIAHPNYQNGWYVFEDNQATPSFSYAARFQQMLLKSHSKTSFLKPDAIINTKSMSAETLLSDPQTTNLLYIFQIKHRLYVHANTIIKMIESAPLLYPELTPPSTTSDVCENSNKRLNNT